MPGSEGLAPGTTDPLHWLGLPWRGLGGPWGALDAAVAAAVAAVVAAAAAVASCTCVGSHSVRRRSLLRSDVTCSGTHSLWPPLSHLYPSPLYPPGYRVGPGGPEEGQIQIQIYVPCGTEAMGLVSHACK